MEEEREYPFEFSVVMAVYNVEPFLREAVDSLIAQDFGFEKIQLIMVDDGSADGSGAICDEYAAQYPENVVAVHKENGGAASARNEGLNYATGRYINFLDADDKLEKQTMSEVYKFFELHENETDVVAIPLIFFDGSKGQHHLNYKFHKGSRVIDLYKEYSMIQLSMSSTFVKRKALHECCFDERLAFAEDAKCLVKILMEKMTLGVVKSKDARYLYRRRTVGALSAIQSSEMRVGWYLPYLHFFCEETIRYCFDRLGYVPKFVQFTIACDLQWKIKLEQIAAGVLSCEEEQQYRSVLFSLLRYIDDDIILAQKHIFMEHKLFMLEKKYGACHLARRHNDVFLCFQNTVAFALSRCQLCWEFMKIDAEMCHLEGYTGFFSLLHQNIEIQLEVNGTIYPCSVFKRDEDKCALGEPILRYLGFRVSFPLKREDDPYSVKMFVVIDGVRIENRNFKYKQFFPVGNEYNNAYYVKDGWKVTVKENQLLISACGRKTHIQSEIAFCKELWKKNKKGGRNAVLARLAYYVLKPLQRKPIWLISDRIIKADDNGEAFFRFMQSEHKRDVKSYFVLSKESVDYARMKQSGPVVDAMSHKHKLLHLLCDYNISAQADAITSNPFKGYSEGYRDILWAPHFIFLQHGITMNDVSGWLKRYNKNLYGFITSAVPEYDSIVNGKYFYTEREVWLTGFPRYDRLYHNEQKCITLMPTWREYLMASVDSQTGIWRLGAGFQNSAYFQFYNRLLNDERLLQAARTYGYRIQFLPHPTLQPHISVFTQNEAVRFLDMNASYREIYAQSNLVVTDYSSAAFDFAYLRKPIVYCQFDMQEFFSGKHVCEKGYFDYERDGFGEVEHDLEGTVDRIIEYMENGCQLKDKYRQRIDNFFAFNDQNNCQRVYDKIMELEQRDQ